MTNKNPITDTETQRKVTSDDSVKSQPNKGFGWSLEIRGTREQQSTTEHEAAVDERNRLREELIAKGILTQIELPPDFRAPTDEEFEAVQRRVAQVIAERGGLRTDQIIDEERGDW